MTVTFNFLSEMIGRKLEYKILSYKLNEFTYQNKLV
jgi:hypothetical protein